VLRIDRLGHGSVFTLRKDLLSSADHDSLQAAARAILLSRRGTLAEQLGAARTALDRSLAVGAHSLPLIGGGDWNDGMNRVRSEGRGESVCLQWFLHSTLWEFARHADARGEHVHAEAWRSHVYPLKTALEKHGWDGDWYRRVYFDDGSPLGSIVNTECRIDSIAQSRGVLSDAAEAVRGSREMAALEEYLVRPTTVRRGTSRVVLGPQVAR
jgi:cellobiose phosphorylase